jgi:hypothetical protein
MTEAGMTRFLALAIVTVTLFAGTAITVEILTLSPDALEAFGDS